MKIECDKTECGLILEYMEYGIEGQRLMMKQPLLMIGSNPARLEEMHVRNKAAKRLLEELRG